MNLNKILKKLRSEEYDIVYEDTKSIVLFPKTERAAAFFSYNTSWDLNKGKYSLNKEFQYDKNYFDVNIYYFIEISKEIDDMKYLYDFQTGTIFLCVMHVSASNERKIKKVYYDFDQRISQGNKSEKIEEYLIRNYIEQGSIGSLALNTFPLSDLYNLTSVNGTLDLSDTKIKNLGKLKEVKGGLSLKRTEIKRLDNLKYVEGSLGLQVTDVSNLDGLEYVGGHILIRLTPLSNKYSKKELEDMYPQFKNKFIL